MIIKNRIRAAHIALTVALITASNLTLAAQYPHHGGWASIHADARNSDALPDDGPSDVEKLYGPLEFGSGSGVTVSPGGILYITTYGIRLLCNLHAYDVATGKSLWCSKKVNGGAASSSVTIDSDEFIYVGDSNTMRSFTPSGEIRWETKVESSAVSTQFLPNGNLVFGSSGGTLYELNTDTGEIIHSRDVAPEISGLVLACLIGSSANCVIANQIAVDMDGNVYFTQQLNGISTLVKADPAQNFAELWAENPILGDASGATPTLSADGTRVYTTGGTGEGGSLFAFDLDTGALIWSFPLGLNSAGSPVVTSDGLIIPARRFMALKDAGDHAEVVWGSADNPTENVVGRHVAAGRIGYTTVARESLWKKPELIIYNIDTGDILDREPTRAISYGISVDTNGYVYTNSPIGGTTVYRSTH